MFKKIFKKKIIIKTRMKYSDYLPVGTIVKLHNDNNNYMIFRYVGNSCMAIKEDNEALIKSNVYNTTKTDVKKYFHIDYFISSYPNPTSIFGILHDDIEMVVWKGYDDEFRKNILNDIDEWSKGELNE